MTLEAMEQRLKALEREVRSLRAELAAALQELERQRRIDLSMRGQHRCPACGGRTILHARKILDRDSGAAYPLAVTSVGFFAPEPRGRFECHICVACGLVEWHVADASEIEIDGETFSIEQADDAQAGPYR